MLAQCWDTVYNRTISRAGRGENEREREMSQRYNVQVQTQSHIPSKTRWENVQFEDKGDFSCRSYHTAKDFLQKLQFDGETRHLRSVKVVTVYTEIFTTLGNEDECIDAGTHENHGDGTCHYCGNPVY